MRNKNHRLSLLAAGFAGGLLTSGFAQADAMKHIGIGSMGPHGSLTQVMEGFKSALADKGFVDGKDVSYEYLDCNFDPALVPQVLSKLEADKPDLMLTVTTPMTQAAVKLVRNPAIPIVFAPVTDPVAAGLVPDWTHGSTRFVGASNQQSMPAVITFAQTLLGKVKSFGMLYNPGESNDVAAKNQAEAAAKDANIDFKAISVDAVNDIQQRTSALAGVDFIYVIPSNLIMPALPALAAAADRMKIPVISSSPQGAQEHLVLAAYSVSWTKIGYSAGVIASKILQGAKPAELANYRPTPADHSPTIDARHLKMLGLTLPTALAGCNCVVD